MNLIRCVHGHFYDGDIYDACPYCTAADTDERTAVSVVIPPRVPISLVPDQLPAPWDDCRVADRLGSGGTGMVFRLRRTTEYALKVVPWHSERSRERARQEYETARKLAGCVHVIRYLDYREADSSSLIFQELSTPWKDYALGRSCTVGDALDAVVQLCDALSAMQAAGILHMDVNPKNVFVSDGLVKLGDFSHAIPLEPGARYDRLIGTGPFMAPEVAYGGVCSGREDIYSLGITMYLLLTGGRFPFDFTGRDPRVRRESDRLLTVFLDRELKRIVEKASAYAPEERYESPAALAADVAAFIAAHGDEMGEKVFPQTAPDPYGDTIWPKRSDTWDPCPAEPAEFPQNETSILPPDDVT